MSQQFWTQVLQAVDRRIVEHLKRWQPGQASGASPQAADDGMTTLIAVDDVTIGINAEGQLYVKQVPIMVTLTDSDGADIVDHDGHYLVEEL